MSYTMVNGNDHELCVNCKLDEKGQQQGSEGYVSARRASSSPSSTSTEWPLRMQVEVGGTCGGLPNGCHTVKKPKWGCVSRRRRRRRRRRRPASPAAAAAVTRTALSYMGECPTCTTQPFKLNGCRQPSVRRLRTTISISIREANPLNKIWPTPSYYFIDPVRDNAALRTLL